LDCWEEKEEAQEKEMTLKEKILAWYDTPERQPKTQRELSLELNVSDAYISQVIAESKGKKRSKAFDIRKYLRSELPEMAEALVATIKSKKSAKSIELALKVLGELVEKQEVTNKFELGAVEYREITGRVLAQLRDSYKELGGNCPVCGQPHPLLEEPRLDSEQDRAEDS